MLPAHHLHPLGKATDASATASTLSTKFVAMSATIIYIVFHNTVAE